MAPDDLRGANVMHNTKKIFVSALIGLGEKAEIDYTVYYRRFV